MTVIRKHGLRCTDSFVLQRIGASLRANPRDFYLEYLNSVHSKSGDRS